LSFLFCCNKKIFNGLKKSLKNIHSLIFISLPFQCPLLQIPKTHLISLSEHTKVRLGQNFLSLMKISSAISMALLVYSSLCRNTPLITHDFEKGQHSFVSSTSMENSKK
jgi:hypothetical protein